MAVRLLSPGGRGGVGGQGVQQGESGEGPQEKDGKTTQGALTQALQTALSPEALTSFPSSSRALLFRGLRPQH